MDKCIYCGSTNLQKEIKTGVSADTSCIGLVYKTLLGSVERFYADLCKDCGSITRLYVKNKDRDWR